MCGMLADVPGLNKLLKQPALLQEFANEGVQPAEPAPAVNIPRTEAMERTSSDHSASGMP